jgi:hypothetical protein
MVRCHPMTLLFRRLTIQRFLGWNDHTCIISPATQPP